MKKAHDITTYSVLSSGGEFYLNEAFHYINEALIDSLASKLFAIDLDKIDLTEEDRAILKGVEFPETDVKLLQADIPEIVSNETINKMSTAWSKAKALSRVTTHKFDLNHNISSIQILGHLNNFGFFIETLVNRHLLFLQQSNLIDDFSYSRITIAKIMERIIFIFKDELRTGKIHINEITNLFSLRNKTVHFTPDNAISLKPKISELIQIWNQTVLFIQALEKVENFNEEKFSVQLSDHTKKFRSTWIN